MIIGLAGPAARLAIRSSYSFIFILFGPKERVKAKLSYGSLTERAKHSEDKPCSLTLSKISHLLCVCYFEEK